MSLLMLPRSKYDGKIGQNFADRIFEFEYALRLLMLRLLLRHLADDLTELVLVSLTSI